MAKRLDDKQLGSLAADVRRLQERRTALTAELDAVTKELTEKRTKLGDTLSLPTNA